MKPLFSIIIPLYNKEAFIENTLKNVFEQTFTDFEIIIVNDGSTDNSLARLEKYKDDRLKLIDQKNQGAAAARNTGISNAKSNLIVFLDADDIWMPNHLEELKRLYEDFPDCGMFCSRYKTKISKNRLVDNSFYNSISDDFRGVVPDFFEASLVNRVAFTSAVMIPKRILKIIGGFDANISSGQDLDLWIRIAVHHKVAISKETTVIYRFEIPKSLSKTSILQKKIIDFKKFATPEISNKSLKRFLDIYRLEYAIRYKIAGNKEKSAYFIKEISSNIPLKSKLLLTLPPSFLRLLLQIKHFLKKQGIDFTIYH